MISRFCDSNVERRRVGRRVFVVAPQKCAAGHKIQPCTFSCGMIPAFVALLFSAVSAFALGPHEILLLANDKSEDSVYVARHYAGIRNVPAVNLVKVSIPLARDGCPVEITPDEFTRMIWEPAAKAMKRRGIEDHILAWVYSVDFPTTITVQPGIARLSVQGLTFLRNHMPDSSIVTNGAFGSSLFCGPYGPDGAAYGSQTFDNFREWMGDKMPLPSMMLGWTGKNGGMTGEQVIGCVESGAASDHTAPSGTVYFVEKEDLRSKTRMWQYPSVAKELGTMGVNAVRCNDLPAGRNDVIGVMMGGDYIVMSGGTSMLPGAVGDHLTSAAGSFDGPDQTKLTFWLKAGAAASSGTVTEPFAIWTKFPNARFFVHYASGCTILESYAQSVRCPLQIIYVGDPLASPWAPKAEVKLEGLSQKPLSGKVKVSASIESARGDYYGKCVYLVDGITAGSGKEFILDTTKYSDGKHKVRCVAYRTGAVRCQAFVEKTIEVKNGK